MPAPWVVIVEATDFSAGIREATCSVCSQKITENFDPEGTLRRGDKGDAVKQLQQALNDNGFDCGKADGKFGAKTEGAVKEFETSKGISADGVAWPGVIKLLGGGKDEIPDPSVLPATLGSLELNVTNVPLRTSKDTDTVTVSMTLTYTGLQPVALTALNANKDDEIPHEAWMSGLLQPGQTYPFTLVAHLSDGEKQSDWAHRYVSAYAEEPIEHTALSDFELVILPLQVTGASLLLVPEDTTGMEGALDETVSVTVYLINNGTETLENIGASMKNGSSDVADGLKGIPEDALFTLVPSEFIELDALITVGLEDVPKGAAQREIEATALGKDSGEAAQDILTLSIPIKGASGLELLVEFFDEQQNSYSEGDTPTFKLLVTNEGEVTLTDVCIQAYDGMDAERELYIAGTLGSDAAMSFDDKYTLTLYDSTLDPLELAWIAYGTAPDGSVVFAGPVTIELETEYNDPALSIVKEVISEAESGTGWYVYGETVKYRITVTNESADDMEFVEIYEPLLGENEDALMDLIELLASEETVYYEYVYTVDYDDVERGYIENTVTAHWTDGEESRTSKSNTVTVNVLDDDEEGSVTIYKFEYYSEYFPYGYALGDEITFAIELANDTLTDISDVIVYDNLNEEGFVHFTTISSLPAGHARIFEYKYKVTEDDVARGYVTNTASMTWFDPQTGTVSGLVTEPVTVVTIGFNASEYPLIVKTVTNEPKNKKFDQENEVITYDITVTNTLGMPIYDVQVRDSKADWNVIGSVAKLEVNESVTYKFSYTVDAQDVENGEVYNYAQLDYTPTREEPASIISQPAISLTGKETPPARSSKGDSCVRTLTGVGDGIRAYKLDYCAEHEKTAEQSDKLLAGALTKGQITQAYTDIAELWAKELQEEYAAMMSGASAAERAVIQNEYELFLEYAASLEEELRAVNGGDEEIVQQKLAELMMNKCADVCYERHNAPKARPDSLRQAVLEALETPQAPEHCAVSAERKSYGWDYSVTLCAKHNLIGSTADELILKANTAEDVLNAKQLWLGELNALTFERYMKVDAAVREVCMAERSAFDAYLAAREVFLEMLYPTKPLIAAEALTDTVRGRVVEFCAE